MITIPQVKMGMFCSERLSNEGVPCEQRPFNLPRLVFPTNRRASEGVEWLIVCHHLFVVGLKFVLFPSCVSHQDSLDDYMKQRDASQSSSSYNNNKQI